VRKLLILLFSIATVIGIATDELKENVTYASAELLNVSTASTADTEKYKAEFAYEMAQITTQVVSAPTTSVEDFKMSFSYATAQVTAKVMPLIPSDQRATFAAEMAQITGKIIDDPTLDVQKAKVEFAYRIAKLTTEIINGKVITSDKNSKLNVSETGIGANTSRLRNNADIMPKATTDVNNVGAAKKAVKTGDVDPVTYENLNDELSHVGERSSHVDHKVDIDGNIRFHYALNSGSDQWKDQSGIRLMLGLGSDIDDNWRVNAMLENEDSVANYNNGIETRLNVTGKLGTSAVTAGTFGYYMAEGNIYDSTFNGVRYDFGEPVRYTLSMGNTDFTTGTCIATARYNDFNYNLEAGIYHYQKDSDTHTIWTLDGNYNFSNFSVGAMYLGSNLKDSKGNSNGYVFNFAYGDLKTYRPGTYDIFAKYYNQSMGTYIEHGMNGLGGLMEGFEGYGFGMHYTFDNNLVGSLQYYDLTDKIVRDKGNTLWADITCYF